MWKRWWNFAGMTIEDRGRREIDTLQIQDTLCRTVKSSFEGCETGVTLLIQRIFKLKLFHRQRSYHVSWMVEKISGKCYLHAVVNVIKNGCCMMKLNFFYLHQYRSSNLKLPYCNTYVYVKQHRFPFHHTTHAYLSVLRHLHWVICFQFVFSQGIELTVNGLILAVSNSQKHDELGKQAT